MNDLVRKAITAAVLGLLTLAAAEVGARLDDLMRSDVPFGASPDEADLTMHDSLGTRGRPNGRFKHWRLNSAGFRGGELEQVPRAGCLRVVVLGASESFGLYESDGKEYPAQLEDSLGRSGCAEVVNAAIPGGSLGPQLRLWQNWVRLYHPDIVVVYPTPAFYLGEKMPGLPQRIVPQPGPEASRGFRPRLLERLKDRVEVPSQLQRVRVRRTLARAIRDRPPEWFFDSPPADRLQAFEDHLDSLATTIAADGGVPLLVTHPSRFPRPPALEDEALLLAWRQFSPRATEATLLSFEDSANTRIRHLAGARGFPLADLALRLTGRRENFADMVHYTDPGAGAAAGVLAEAIRRIPAALIPRPSAAVPP